MLLIAASATLHFTRPVIPPATRAAALAGPSRSRRGGCEMVTVAASLDATEAALSSIRAAPAESSAPAPHEPLASAPWRHAFSTLVSHRAFVSDGFGEVVFKLEEHWEFAVGAFTMEDVARDVTLLPPQFVASGMRHQGGVYNQPFAAGFSFADVDTRMDSATVVMLNAGFLVPKLASISLAMLEATGLPIWLNVYLSKPGLATSTQLHTDAQDVVLVQCTGRKRWRVYRPPPPGKTPSLDPFARGKGTDHMEFVEEDLLIDTVMEPGQELHIPTPSHPLLLGQCGVPYRKEPKP